MSSETLLQRLRELLPTIRARSAEIEQQRRLPKEIVDALRATNLFALEIPRALGGQEAEPADIFRAIELISTADGSTGWCAMIAAANSGAAGFASEAGAREVFSDPSAPCAGVFAPAGAARRVEGGVRISGRWPFASGIGHCDWVWLGCVVMQDEKPRMTATGPEIIHAFVPVKDVEVHDTWFVSGLCGTGSNDVSVKDVFVPERRIFDIMDPSTHRKEPLYRLPPLGAFVSHVAAVSLGLARGALDLLVELAQQKVPALSSAVLADRSMAQIELARAEATLASARAFFYETVHDLWATVREGKQPAPRQVALNRLACANAAEAGASVTRRANVVAGGSSIFASSQLQRHARDAEAVLHHFTVAPHVWEDVGRVLLGRQPLAPMF